MSRRCDGSARELLAQAENTDEEAGGENAREFLRYLLATGPMRAADVFRDGEAHGYSKRQMQRARAAIGARIEKAGMREGWEWSLPKMPPAPEEPKIPNKIIWHLRHLRLDTGGFVADKRALREPQTYDGQTLSLVPTPLSPTR
jgi:hypothetical protein